jgi:hypothetical protein
MKSTIQQSKKRKLQYFKTLPYVPYECKKWRKWFCILEHHSKLPEEGWDLYSIWYGYIHAYTISSLEEHLLRF